jgi:hypothetical protein
MSNDDKNQLVIECSPFNDSETEIHNLKSPSYEIMSMPDIFDYEKSLSVFLLVVGILGSTFLGGSILITIINNPKTLKSFPSIYLHYLLYFALLVIGFFASTPLDDDETYNNVYIAFGVVILIIGGVRIHEMNQKVVLNANIIFELIFPRTYGELGGDYTPTSFVSSIGGWVFVYGTIMVLRWFVNISASFNPNVLLGSYCFLHILNYMFINKQSRSVSNTPALPPGSPANGSSDTTT